jgi:hypothetical protein
MGEETRIGTIAIASFIGTFYIFSSFTPIIATELLASTGASWSILHRRPRRHLPILGLAPL